MKISREGQILFLMEVYLFALATPLFAEDIFAPKELEFFSTSKIKKISEIRDPFKRPKITKSDKKLEVDEKYGSYRDGVYTNLPGVEAASPEDINVVGVLIGKDRRAMVKTPGSDQIKIVREGMILGQGNDKFEIKAIMPGGVVVVEKIINVYGQEEYLETVLPIVDGNTSVNVVNDVGNVGGKSFIPASVAVESGSDMPMDYSSSSKTSLPPAK
ncbi:MAG: hypothetical protein HQK52_00150 [Oligoflexia bacterium]|nr:hypothetical protein [Oligoflexia bacterium]